MAKSVLELAVDTGKWEGGIRKAQTALNNFTKDQGGLQQALQKNSGKVKDFLSIMGNVESKANTAKGKMNDYKNVIAQLDSMQRQLNETDRHAFGADFQRAIDAAREKFRQAKDEVDELNRSLNDVKAPQMGNVGGGLLGGLDLKGMAGGLVGFSSVAGGAMMAANALKGAVENNIETAKNFELSMSHLSSLTGLTGEKLDYLKKKAIDLGGSTTQSASQVAEAFMLIGSKMPELLNDADALSQVTEAAIRLAEASGGTVTESANALTASLNIMGEGADQANRYINVLAAGSQKGTRSIDELSTIVFRAGQSAHSSGMSFEELIAIAASGTKEFDSAESAGQGLSKLFVQLEKQGNDKLKPSVVGVTEAIRNLTEANFSQVEAIKLFTVNGAAAYRSIIDNKDAILETLPAITGTNTALEQAATNTANLDGALKSLSSAWEKLNLTLNDNNSELTHAVQKLTDLVNMMTDGVNACKDMSDAWDDAMGAMSTSIANFLRQSGFKELAEFWDKFDKFASGLGFGGEGSNNNTNTNNGTGKKYRNRATGKVGNSVEEVRTVVYKGTDGKIYKTLEEARKAGNKTVTKTYDDSTLKGIRAHINALKEERLKVDADSQAYANLTAEITRLEAKLKNPKTPKAPKADKSLKDAFKLDKVEGLSGYEMAVSVRMPSIDEIKTLISQRTKELNNSDDAFKRIELRADIEDLKSQLAELTADPLKIDIVFPESYKKGAKSGNDKPKDKNKTFDDASDVVSGLSSIKSGLEGLGVDFGDDFNRVFEAIQGVMSIISGVIAVNDVIQTGLLSDIATNTTVSAATSVIPFFHNGGIVHAANGIIVPGAPNGGRDTVPAMLSPQEVVLNAGQAANVAEQLQSNSNGGGFQGQPYLQSETIWLGVGNHLKRTGQGEIITSKNIHKYIS